MSLVQTIKGFADLFTPASDGFTHIESVAREVSRRYGYTELRTPIVEHTELFCRSIGTETDVVQKEMYTFPDRKERSLTLRPEATAGVMRAYIESGRYGMEPVTKVFTYGPMFRYERPQKGRMRQFHQINCECLGAQGPHTDAETICLLMDILRGVGIADVTLLLNSLGCAECRPGYRAVLAEYLRALAPDALCEDCRRRIHTSPLRVLDCKVPTCRQHTEAAPRILDHNCPDCRSHFDTVLDLLGRAGVLYVLEFRLVRGLDYYCRTTFEAVSGAVGAQSSIAGGGRYDGLIQQLGGPDVPGVGFAAGMERLSMLLPARLENEADFFVVALGDVARDAAFALVRELRTAGLAGDMSHTGGSFKSQMRQADKSGARYSLIIGESELAAGQVQVKDMRTGVQTAISQNSIAQTLAQEGQVR